MRRVTDITVTLKDIGVSVLLGLLSQGCSQEDATRSVGGRTFVVPRSYLSGIANIRPDGDDIVSYYVYQNDPDRYIAVCADADMPDNLGGMCAAIYSYKELKFTIRFRESAISELPGLAKSSVALLSSWERG